MSTHNSISATNLAVYHHLNCDLYLHNVYHKHTQPTTPEAATRLDTQLLVESQYQRGMNWEATLYSWLDASNLLLRVPARPLEPDVLLENILADDRDQFFIAGVTFIPPQDLLQGLFESAGTQPIKFGVSKPDLIEIKRAGSEITWTVIDAKASKAIKTSHHAQIYFYSLCLNHILNRRPFRFSGSAGIWLPPEDGFNMVQPSLADIKMIVVSLLQPSLDTLLFERLPRLLSLPREKVRWHFNPLCQGCKFNQECRTAALDGGRLGAMPNISISDSRNLLELVTLAEQSIPGFRRELSDIEDLHNLVSNPRSVSTMESKYPIAMKKGKRILNMSRKKVTDEQSPVESPVLESARSTSVIVIPRRNFTCPSNEDVPIVLSLVQDPATPKPQVEYFTLSMFERHSCEATRNYSGQGTELIPTLAAIIRELTARKPNLPTAQFYVWSTGEQTLLQAHLIKSALLGEGDSADIRICIGALAQGASLLQTAFQPILLSGALLSFLAKGKRLKAEYQAVLSRMDLPTTGTVPELRARVIEELERLQGIGSRARRSSQDHEYGQIPRVVVLKKEIESMLALPIPGYWDLQECAEVLIDGEFYSGRFPTDEAIFATFKDDDKHNLESALGTRNSIIYSVLKESRQRLLDNGQQLLVNEGKRITTDFMDMCRQPHLSKLFFMQQFEVLSKLSELWSNRIQGNTESPVLQYRGTTTGSRGIEHTFTLLSGVLDVPSSEKDVTFFDKLLVEDKSSDTEVPVEAMFDDLAVSGFVIPLNRWTKPHWESQHPRVRQDVLLADLSNVESADGQLVVALRTWGTSSRSILVPGSHYRLSPRLVDFNTTKILSTLFEMDLQWENAMDVDGDDPTADEGDHRGIPFLRLVTNPRSFGRVPNAKEALKIEENTQRLFRNLKTIDVSTAGSLLLKPSQHRATQRLLANRLAVIWGPPGTGKTHTIALSILRLLEAQWKLGDTGQKVIFLTAMTHAAIDACQSKLEKLMAAYHDTPNLDLQWLNNVRVERVLRGTEHQGPHRTSVSTHVYAGTLYQLYNFSKKHNLEVDCVIADEAGQIALASLSLVLRDLSPTGRIIIAGDSEQLAPIFTGTYPRLKTAPLFGSVLDCVMFSGDGPVVRTESQTESQEIPSESPNQGTVIQLTENFRLNPDLGEFVATIYSHQFKPQKVQPRKLALGLRNVHKLNADDCGVNVQVLRRMQSFLLALSDVMLRRDQKALSPPRVQSNVPLPQLDREPPTQDVRDAPHQPVSLSLIKLETMSSTSEQFGYETHVHGEAAVAAALVASLQICAPDDDIFVATPHRVQREAVKSALAPLKRRERSLEDRFAGLSAGDDHLKNVTVDTVERLQGSEASFVICLFSLPENHSADLGFLLGRRRLNVAISRAKNLCILVTSSQVLCPPVTVFANEETAKGYAFLKAYEDRAWSYEVEVDVGGL